MQNADSPRSILRARYVYLSGGEQAKVRLCKLINKDTNLLILDEPTNHLDVDAKDASENVRFRNTKEVFF